MAGGERPTDQCGVTIDVETVEMEAKPGLSRDVGLRRAVGLLARGCPSRAALGILL